MLPALLFGAEVSYGPDAGRVDVSVVRRVSVEYRLLTRARPAEFEVAAPEAESAAWLRVYTRAWWPAGATGRLRYAMSLWHGDVERPLAFEAGLSGSSRGPGGHRVGEWRSFFVRLQPAVSRYRLALVEGAVETVAVRMVFQSPRPWRTLPLPGLTRLTLVEGAGRPDSLARPCWRVAAGETVAAALTGPCRVRVRSRISYGPGLLGDQNYVLVVSERGHELVRRNLRVSSSPGSSFVEAPDVVPSTERTVRFTLDEGAHVLTLRLAGTLASSGALAVEYLPDEEYE
ncbi:hypothetical protein FJY71_09970 [candidate division WOR-3 bacterium]|nr:hypothetical protein [candidate division WOR-3 bacterium]